MMTKIEAKKSLGQNWLKSPSAIKEIIKAGEIKTEEWVLEIGPGQGILTRALLDAGAKVIATEKDDRLIDFLKEEFKDEIKEGRLTLVHDDILDLDFSAIWKLKASPYKLIANIPYYITGQVIRKFLSEEKLQPDLMVLMVQKEVARRITGELPTSKRETKKENLLSLSIKVYGEPKYIKTVPAGAFEPKPNVDSAILQVKNISKQFFVGLDEEKFFSLLKKGFGQKRKLLKNNLNLEEKDLHLCQIEPKARAEDLNLENWKCLNQITN